MSTPIFNFICFYSLTFFGNRHIMTYNDVYCEGIDMTETTKTIFEKYQVRKTRKQKAAFRKYAIETAESMGYTTQVEKGNGSKNVIIGNPETAKVIYTAHYDTCARLPFPNIVTPKNIGVYILYNLAIVLGIVLLVAGLTFAVLAGCKLIFDKVNISFETADMIYDIVDSVVWILFLVLITCGPANRHTANDNTSGVTTLFDIMAAMPDELKDKAAFIFFDNEELGLFGSSAYASKHKDVKNSTPVINFDCVSDGNDFIFAVNKKANKDIVPLLEEAYKSDSFGVEVLTKGVFYPSDQKNFKQGVGVAALNKTKKGMLYMNRIHTKKDTVYTEENIEFLVDASVKFTELI